MNLPNKFKLILFLSLVALVLMITRLLTPPQPRPTPLSPGTTTPPTNKSFIRRFVPKSLLPSPKPTITVVVVNPLSDEERVGLFKPIQVSFNKTVEPQKVKLFASPNITFASPVATGQATLVFDHQEPFQPKTRYTINAFLENRPLLSWSFTTAETQYDPSLFEERKQYYQENLPLLYFVPFESDRVLVNYVGPKKLKVVLKSGSRQTAETEVFNWMHSHGVDPDSHKIEWVKPSK